MREKSVSKLAENAIRLNEKFTQLRAMLGPAIEAAKERERQRDLNVKEGRLHSLFLIQTKDNDMELLAAGEILDGGNVNDDA